MMMTTLMMMVTTLMMMVMILMMMMYRAVRSSVTSRHATSRTFVGAHAEKGWMLLMTMMMLR